MIPASINGHNYLQKHTAIKLPLLCVIVFMMVTSCHRFFEEIPLENYGFAPVPATEITTATNPPERTYVFECTLNEFATWLTKSDIYYSAMGFDRTQEKRLVNRITAAVNETGARTFIEGTGEKDRNLHFRVKAKAIGKEDKVKVTVEVFELR